MKQLEQFFLLIDQCLNDTEFIRKHALSEKDFTRNRILTFRNTFWGLLAHTGADQKILWGDSISFSASIFKSQKQNELHFLQRVF